MALHVSAAVFSQKVTIAGRHMALLQVFESIREQTGYNFVYNMADIGRAHSVSLDVHDAPLKDVLDQCFRDQSLAYKLVNRIIVVTELETPRAESPGRASDPRCRPRSCAE